MRTVAFLSRIPQLLASCLLLLALHACGSSATSVTSPTSLTRCGITMQPVEGPLPASGGTAIVTVLAARECAWSASVEGTWLSVRSGASGQGDGTVELGASANPDPVMRRGALLANGLRAEIQQAAGDCTITLGRSSESFPQAGGNSQVPVNASSALCAWSASVDEEWVRLRATTGQGSGSLAFEVPPSSGPPRSATITVGGQKFSIIQSEGCTYTITPDSHAAAPAGGAGTIAVATAPACPWTAASNVPWLTFSPGSGTGPGTVTFTVAPTSGRSRTGTAVVAGQPFSVTQSQGCSFSVQPTSSQVGASGGTVRVSIAANPECEWSAASNDSWITVQGRSPGAGDGSVTFAVASTTGPSRSGGATVAGQRVTISQGQGCAFSISPETASSPAGGGSGRVTVTTAGGCGWSASSNVSWLRIDSGTSGTGNGEVRYTVSPTNGPDRTGTMTIAGRTFTVNQGDGCRISLPSSSANIPDEGGSGNFTVETGSSCAWSASSTVPWVRIDGGANATGNGQVRFTVDRNAGPPREGPITVTREGVEQRFTIRQGDGCSVQLSSGGQTVPATGGNGNVTVTAGNGCPWSATSDAPWLRVTSGATGNGGGAVGFTADANPSGQRQGALTIGGQPFRVTQEGCTFSIAPDQASVGAAQGTTTVTVTATAGCAWTASSGAPWLSIAAGGTGSGSGTVQIGYEGNTGGNRSGTATIAGHPFTLHQAGGCTFSINPTAHSAPAGAGSVVVNVAAGASCPWTASSTVPWLTVPSNAGGSGGGAVQVDIQANSGAARTGTVTIAGQALTVNQEAGCSFAVAPEVVTAPAGGATTPVSITGAAGCAWTAAPGAPWLSITSPASGSGSGSVGVVTTANDGPPRTGTVTIAGRTVTVNQESGCVVSVAPGASDPIAAAGGAGSFSVTAGAACPWTAASTVPWLTVTAGSPGTGPGTVQFSVSANATGAARSGTITVGGAVYTVNQQ